MTNKKGMMVAAILVVVLLIYSLIGEALGLTSVWVGFLFFWYWSSIKHHRVNEVKGVVLGSLVGIGLGYILYYLHHVSEGIFTIGIIIILAVVLFCLVTKQVRLFINETTLLFITVLGAPQFMGSPNYIEYILSFALAAIYFPIVLTFTFKALSKGKEQAETTESH